MKGSILGHQRGVRVAAKILIKIKYMAQKYTTTKVYLEIQQWKIKCFMQC